MSSMPWVKLYTEMLYDPKIGRLQDAIKWRFVSLILLAGECDQDGALMTGTTPMNIDDIAWKMRVTREQCETEIESLLNCGVLALDDDLYYLPKFSERQGRPQSEKRAAWRDRKAKQREKQASQETKDSVTRESRGSHAPRVDKSREEKSKKKIKNNGAEKEPRPIDPLFDAISKVTCTDPKTAGASIGKVESVFKKAEPPYTSEDVLRFGELWPAWKEKPPTLWQLQEQIGIVRQNGNGSNNGAKRESPMIAAIREAQKDPNYGKRLSD